MRCSAGSRRALPGYPHLTEARGEHRALKSLPAGMRPLETGWLKFPHTNLCNIKLLPEKFFQMVMILFFFLNDKF